MPFALNSQPEGRFEFGENWKNFLNVLDENRIATAEASLRHALGEGALREKSFLDIGSGSGLFSLAAVRLGATSVRSFDFDPESVAATTEVKRRYCPAEVSWTISRGDVLDTNWLATLGQFDIVYSWGVLHHTGNLWQALGNALTLVAPGGTLYIAIYNHQGLWTRWNTIMKGTYVRAPRTGKFAMVAGYGALEVLRGTLKDLLLLRNPLRRYSEKRKARGMSVVHDWVDWVGGFPFEAASPDSIFRFCHDREFVLKHLKTCGGGPGCNEYVFARKPC